MRDVFGTAQRSAQAAFDYRVRKAALGPRDRAFAAELAYGAIKMRRTLDWYLRPYLAKRGQPLPAAIAEALRLGAYQVHFMGGVEGHAAVFETVGAALRVGHRGTAGLVNAILRRMVADDATPPARADFASDAEYLGTRYSVPDWIAAQVQDRFGADAEAVLAGDRPRAADGGARERAARHLRRRARRARGNSAPARRAVAVRIRRAHRGKRLGRRARR